jgi:hypothetical protein
MSSQNDRRAELGRYVAELQTHTDDTGGRVVLFPSDFTRLVEELFHSKLDGDRAADLQVCCAIRGSFPHNVAAPLHAGWSLRLLEWPWKVARRRSRA